MNYDKCPFCNKTTIVNIQTTKGTNHFLSTVDTGTTPPTIDSYSGIAVDIYDCSSCGTMWLHNPALVK